MTNIMLCFCSKSQSHYNSWVFNFLFLCSLSWFFFFLSVYVVFVPMTQPQNEMRRGQGRKKQTRFGVALTRSLVFCWEHLKSADNTGNFELTVCSWNFFLWFKMFLVPFVFSPSFEMALTLFLFYLFQAFFEPTSLFLGSLSKILRSAKFSQ